MSDPISTDSTQAFIKTTFNPAMTADTVLAIVDSDGNPLAAYMSDRDYTVLTFSSPSLSSGASYSLYTDGTLNGTEDTHSPEGTSLYTSVSSYTGGTFLSNVTASTNPDNQPGGGDQPGPGGDTPPTPPSGEDNPPTPPNDVTPDPDDPSNDTPSNGGDNSSDNNTNDGDSTLVDGVPNDYLEDGETVILVEDNESVAVPSTSAYTVTYPSTGRSTKAESGSLRSTPSFAWAVSGCSAVALILYAVAERKKHAVRFQR
ncbi:hypothetical protein IJ090_00280, partial [Candidatus Saccharibacteria bacterium]|nr:hypothetical protein [Candidatus Saccharibacteria bacterium]